jgi:WD40 repeat protein
VTTSFEGEPTLVRQRASAAEGSTVVQVGGDLYVSEEGLSAFWEPVATTPGECPYPGLEAFGLAQAKWFFGREKVTGDLVDILDRVLRAGRGGPVTVVGPSGAGKSSVLGAGLLKALRDGRLAAAGSDGWPVLTLTPGATPVRTLTRALNRCAAALSGSDAAADGPETWEQALAQLRDALRPTGDSATGSADGSVRRVVLVADQFEELFTADCPEAELTSFLDALSALAAPGPGGALGVVVVGMRADFYVQATRFPVLRDALQSAQLVIGAMTTAEVTEAITRPARQAGLRLDGGLAERLLRDLGAGADGGSYEAGRLPLLAYALRATWQRRSGNRLTIAAYEQTGGIGGAIAKAAEDVYNSLDPSRQQVERQLFLSLVHLGSADASGEGTLDTRRRVGRERLCGSVSDPRAAAEVLDAFTAARLITSGGQTVEITHDALLTRWPRLQEWISGDRRGNLTHQALEEAAEAWNQGGRRDSGALYSGQRLEEADKWADDTARPHDMSATARDFLTASRRKRRTAKYRLYGSIAVLVALCLGLAGLYGFAKQSQAEAQRSSQLASGDGFVALADQAVSLNDPGTAMEFAVEADRLNPAAVEVQDGVLNAQSQSFTGRLAVGGILAGVAYSPDGTMLATADLSGHLQLWNAATHARISSLTPDKGHKAGLLAFSPSGKLLISDEPDGVRFWSVSGHQLKSLGVASLKGPAAVAFNPAGTLLAVGTDFGQVILYDLATGKPAGPYLAESVKSTQQQIVEGLQFSADGTQLVSAVGTGTVRIWDVTANQLGATLRVATTLPVNDQGGSLAMSRNGLVAIENLINGTANLQLWHLATGTFDVTLPYSQVSIDTLAFSPDGSLLGAGYSTGLVRVWDVARPSPTLALNLAGHTDQVVVLAFSPDGKTLATGDADGSVALWSVLANTVDGYNDGAAALAFNSAGTLLAVASVPGGTAGVTLYTVPGRQKVASLVGSVPGATYVSAEAFGPGGGMLAVAYNDPHDTVLVWDVAQRRVVATIPTGQVGTIHGMVFSAHGGLLATSGIYDSVIKLWNPATGSLAGTLPGNAGSAGSGSSPGVWSLAMSKDATELVAGEDFGVTRLWHITATGGHTGQTVLPNPSAATTATIVDAVAFSRDGAYLAAGFSDGSIVVWTTGCSKCVARYRHGDSQPIWSIGFSADGKTLLTSSTDNYVRLWPVGTWQTPVTFTAGGQSLSAMAVSPVGSTIATEDGTAVRLWDTDPASVAAQICRTLPVPVTQAAWTQYDPSIPYTPIC